jgi:hypothetical protein
MLSGPLSLFVSSIVSTQVFVFPFCAVVLVWGLLMPSWWSRVITFVAFAQIVPLVLFPWTLSLGSLVAILVLCLLAAFLGWSLYQRKKWGRTLTIFVQGLNIIVRLITLFANVYRAETGLNVPLLVTYVLSAAFSGVILSYVDRPEVQLAFES